MFDRPPRRNGTSAFGSGPSSAAGAGAFGTPTNDRHGLTVVVNDDDFERALRVFKRKVGQSGILKELKLKRHYEKPSVKKKAKQAEAMKKRRKYGF